MACCRVGDRRTSAERECCETPLLPFIRLSLDWSRLSHERVLRGISCDQYSRLHISGWCGWCAWNCYKDCVVRGPGGGSVGARVPRGALKFEQINFAPPSRATDMATETAAAGLRSSRPASFRARTACLSCITRGASVFRVPVISLPSAYRSSNRNARNSRPRSSRPILREFARQSGLVPPTGAGPPGGHTWSRH